MLRVLLVVNVNAHTHDTYGVGPSLHFCAMTVELSKKGAGYNSNKNETDLKKMLAVTRFHLCWSYFFFK